MEMYKGLEIFDSRHMIVGECPTWDEKNKIFYHVDIRGKCFYKTDYASGRSEKFDAPQMLGCMALCEDGDLILSMEDGIYFRNQAGELALAHKLCHIKGLRFNDGKVGPDGCYYVGTADDNNQGAFYRLSDGDLTELFDGCGCSNGLDWSGDGKRLYYCDTRKQKLEAFDFSSELHSVSNRKAVLDIPESDGGADGMTIDANGNLWIAMWGGWCVLCVEAETGWILRKIELPVEKVSSCCFAGEDMRDLIITTASVRTSLDEQPMAGNTFVYRSDVPGVYINRYKK